MKIKVAVCEMHNNPTAFARDWEQLVAHVQGETSQLVVLPELPFSPWFAATRHFDPSTWQAAVTSHDVWYERLRELAPAKVLSSRPVNRASQRLNEGFLWEPEHGYRPAHLKYYLPDEEGVWEASWYQRGTGDFTPIESDNVRIGLLICSELWSMEHARAYGKAGVHLIATPRMTQTSTGDKWLAGGRTAAIVSGAFCLSSNRISSEGETDDFGGQGWVIGPDGEVLGLTSRQQPFVTLEIDIRAAEAAKRTYPRYVFSGE